MKAGAQIVDRGDINDPVSNVDDIGNMGRDSFGSPRVMAYWIDSSVLVQPW
ncbi:MAG: hypothetical protein ACLUD2_06415 [Clostridium sp.]